MAELLAKGAQQIVDKYAVHIESGSQRGGLPKGYRDDIAELLIRTFHVLGFRLEWVEEKLSSALTDGQVDAFLAFFAAHQHYCAALTFRAKKLELSPDNFTELKRLRSVVNWSLVEMKNTYEKFERLFKAELKSPNMCNSADAKRPRLISSVSSKIEC